MAGYRESNPGWLERLMNRYRRNKPLEAAVGFPAGEGGIANPHYENGASILEAATWNNFGTENIPRRPFMDLAAEKMQPKFKKMMRDAAKRINAGEITLKTELEAAAAIGRGEVYRAIVDGKWEPNSPRTIARKGEGKNPLTDTGDMGNSVTSVVRARST